MYVPLQPRQYDLLVRLAEEHGGLDWFNKLKAEAEDEEKEEQRLAEVVPGGSSRILLQLVLAIIASSNMYPYLPLL